MVNEWLKNICDKTLDEAFEISHVEFFHNK